jgi:hypothetical protein
VEDAVNDSVRAGIEAAIGALQRLQDDPDSAGVVC